MNYILVAKLKDHWGNIPNQETSYDLNLIPSREFLHNLNENVVSYFVNINSYQPKRLWRGFVKNIKINGNHLFFKVEVTDELEWDTYFDKYNKIGWYVDNKIVKLKYNTEAKINNQNLSINNNFDNLPQFVKNLLNSNSYASFEDGVNKLIKLIGVNDLFDFDKRNQRGMADGFFIFKDKLVVIYDATLENNYINVKAQQINNYVNILKEGKIDYYDKRSFNIANYEKQVWIVTKGQSKQIKIQDNIKIKEISIDDLYNIYLARIQQNYELEILISKLINIV